MDPNGANCRSTNAPKAAENPRRQIKVFASPWTWSDGWRRRRLEAPTVKPPQGLLPVRLSAGRNSPDSHIYRAHSWLIYKGFVRTPFFWTSRGQILVRLLGPSQEKRGVNSEPVCIAGVCFGNSQNSHWIEGGFLRWSRLQIASCRGESRPKPGTRLVMDSFGDVFQTHYQTQGKVQVWFILPIWKQTITKILWLPGNSARKRDPNSKVVGDQPNDRG